jgi:hypothetical protein
MLKNNPEDMAKRREKIYLHIPLEAAKKELHFSMVSFESEKAVITYRVFWYPRFF